MINMPKEVKVCYFMGIFLKYPLKWLTSLPLEGKISMLGMIALHAVRV